MRISTIVRMILSAALIWGVYSETGPVTTAFASLVCVGVELNTYAINAIKKAADIAKYADFVDRALDLMKEDRP